MKKYIYILIFIMTGCDKGLDLVPLSQISEKTFWLSPSDFELGANALYPLLDEPSFDDNKSDITMGNDFDPHSNGTLVIPESSSIWNSAYANIRTANVILEKVMSYKNRGEISKYEGETLFFRAFFYFKLFKTYGGVPLYTQVLDAKDEDLYKPRSSRQETVDFILKDLDEAINKLPSKSEMSVSEIGRISKEAALAFKARVALFEGTWNKFHEDGSLSNKFFDMAIQASKVIIDGGKFRLFTGNGIQSYRYQFIEEGDNSSETILDRRYQAEVSESSFGWYASYGYSVPTKKLADMYLSSNGLPIDHAANTLFQGYNSFTSEFQNRDPRMAMAIITPGLLTVRPHDPLTPKPNWPGEGNGNRNTRTGYMNYKFLSENVIGNTTWGKHSFDWHILRYAEVLLTYAEAVFEKNGTISDADLDLSINKLRDRVGMPKLTNEFVSSYGLNMRKEIRRERTIELAFEIFRYDDLRRWKTASIEMTGVEIRGVKIVGSDWATRVPYKNGGYNSDANGFIIAEPATNRLFADKNYLDPIPSKEIALNPALKQNPGW